MAEWRPLRVTFTCASIFFALSGSALAQARTGGIEAGAALGGGTIDGIHGGVPPSGNPLMGSARLSIGAPVRGIRVSAETEVALSGDRVGKQILGGPPFFTYRERRREVWWSLLAGGEIWEPHHVGSLHVVGGMSYVNPIVAAATQPCCSGSWTSIDANYQSTWAATLGIDLLARFGRVSVGPNFRWYGSPTRATFLGLTASYHF